MNKAIQEYYPDKVNHCFGCGKLNDHGLQIRSYWDGNECICTFMPEKYHKAFEGFVYGGLIASIIDCHSIATALAVAYEKDGLSLDSEPAYGFVTASLRIDYLKPTPNGQHLRFVSKLKEIHENKIKISTVLSVEGSACAKGEVTAIKLPLNLLG